MAHLPAAATAAVRARARDAMTAMVSALGCGVSARLGGCRAGVPHPPAAAASAVGAMRWMLGLETMVVVALHVGCLNACLECGSVASGMQRSLRYGFWGLCFAHGVALHVVVKHKIKLRVRRCATCIIMLLIITDHIGWLCPHKHLLGLGWDCIVM